MLTETMPNLYTRRSTHIGIYCISNANNNLLADEPTIIALFIAYGFNVNNSAKCCLVVILFGIVNHRMGIYCEINVAKSYHYFCKWCRRNEGGSFGFGVRKVGFSY